MKDLGRKRLIVAIEDFDDAQMPSFSSACVVSECGMDITEALERIYVQRGDMDFVIKCPKELPQFPKIVEFVLSHDSCFFETVPQFFDVYAMRAEYEYHFISPEDKIVFLWRDEDDMSYMRINWEIRGADIANNLYAASLSCTQRMFTEGLQVMDLFGSIDSSSKEGTGVEANSESDSNDNLQKMNLFGLAATENPDLIAIYSKISTITRSWITVYLRKATIRFDEDNNSGFDEYFNSAQFIADTLKEVRTAENTVQVEKASILMEHILDHEAVIAGIMEEY